MIQGQPDFSGSGFGLLEWGFTRSAGGFQVVSGYAQNEFPIIHLEEALDYCGLPESTRTRVVEPTEKLCSCPFKMLNFPVTQAHRKR